VPRQAQIALLATGALAAFTVAGLRIAHAARSGHPEWQTPVFGSSPATEAAVVASLRVPPGFRRYQPCVEKACFVLGKSVPLDAATARHLAEAFGVKVATTYAVGSPVECGLLLDRRVCDVEGVVRDEYVSVSVDRPEVRNRKPRTARNRRTYRRWVLISGTEVEVFVLGHCLRPKQCEEERRQEVAERSRL
jgi:hypothetical protein